MAEVKNDIITKPMMSEAKFRELTEWYLPVDRSMRLYGEFKPPECPYCYVPQKKPVPIDRCYSWRGKGKTCLELKRG